MHNRFDEGSTGMIKPHYFEGTGMPDPDWWHALWPDPAGVVRAVGIRPGMTVLDLCCGDGWFTLEAARIAKRLFAVDLDGPLLDAARRRLADAGVTKCAFVQIDAFDVAEIVDEPVDFVLLANAFHGVHEKPRLVEAVHAVSKADALFAVINWHARAREETVVLGQPRGPAEHLRMTLEATIAAVEPGGFALRRVIDVSPYHYAAVFQRMA